MKTRAIAFIREQKVMTPDKPFFAYISYGAVHIRKYRGKFDLGWDKQREETFARQKQLGVIPQDAQLTKRPQEIAAWESLSADEKRPSRRDRRPDDVSSLPGRVGTCYGHPLPMDKADCLPLGRHAQRRDSSLAHRHKGEGRIAPPMVSCDRCSADHP